MTAGQDLASYFSRLQWDDLPADVQLGTRRLLLDTIGCIVSAKATEAGTMASQFAQLLGGDTVAAKAYSHGRLADAMDYNDGYSGAHFGAGGVAAALALARDNDVTGKDLLLAIAAGFELGARVQDAVGSYYSVIDGKQSFAKVWGIATPIVYAAAAAASRLLKFDAALTTQAWGLAGSNAPIPVGAKWSGSLDLPNTKYADAGWCSLAGVTAALSARFGNTGITSLLDDPDGLLRMVSATSPSHAAFTSRLGERWAIRDVVYKDWPVCGLLEGPMRLMQQLAREHGIAPRDVEAIEVEVGSAILVPRFVQQHPRTFVSLQFNLPHAMAMTLLGVPPGPRWLSLDFARQSQVAALRSVVTAREHRVPWPPNSRARACSVKVTSRDGRSWFAESLPAEGDAAPAWDDEWATRKFMTLVQAPEAQRLVDAVMNIAELPSTRTLIAAVESARPIA
jgi:2-methylcitrate dehydratase PrpD